MTTEEMAIDVAGRQAALKAKGLMGDGLGEQLKASLELVGEKTPYDEGGPFNLDTIAKQRKPRKDKGTHRVKPPAIAQQPGKISAEQYERLNDLIVTAEDRRKEYEVAADNEAKALAHLEAAIRERNNFIDELAGKGK